MFNKSESDGFSQKIDKKPVLEPITLTGRDQEELWRIKREVDTLLTGKTLADIDLEQELVSQLQLTKRFLEEVIENVGVPANQRAQAINSCTSVLSNLCKIQIELYNAERVKAMESALVKALRTLDKPAQEEFFKRYQDFYRESDTTGILNDTAS